MAKRQATTDLNHENWDQDDPAEDSTDQENGSGFKIASKNILEKRVIRTAKRRSQALGDEPKKSVFGGFGGFMKTQPASFDFLSKLTNGNNKDNSNDNNTSTSKMDSPVTSSLFTSKRPATSPDTGLFSQTSSTITKSPFGSPSALTGGSPLFGVSSTNTNTASNMFSTSKADSTVGDSPFKIQTVTSSTDNNKTDLSKLTATTTLASTKFDIPTSSDNVAKSLFSSSSNASPFKIQPTINSVVKSKSELSPSEIEKKSEDNKNEPKMKYYSKLKGLNESVCDWIKKHVEQTPLCILTPIFKDYEKYLKEIQDEYQGASQENKKVEDTTTLFQTKYNSGSDHAKTISNVTMPVTTGSTLFKASPTNSVFASQNNSKIAENKQASFSFGINASSTSTSSTITTSSAGFTFGMATSSSQSMTTITSPFSAGTTTSSPFSFATNTSTTTNGSAAPFSFGSGKPFSFANVKPNTETTAEPNKEDEDDTPPKVEYTPVVEENSVYDKKCKIFVKKEGNYVDKGVGTLYIKKIEESGKHQLLVRANTNLGTILVNLILVSAIPTQRMGKNNVMMVCIPTPDSKPPPTPILIRVRSSEEADELLTTLDKYKT